MAGFGLITVIIVVALALVFIIVKVGKGKNRDYSGDARSDWKSEKKEWDDFEDEDEDLDEAGEELDEAGKSADAMEEDLSELDRISEMSKQNIDNIAKALRNLRVLIGQGNFDDASITIDGVKNAISRMSEIENAKGKKFIELEKQSKDFKKKGDWGKRLRKELSQMRKDLKVYEKEVDDTKKTSEEIVKGKR